MRKDIPLSDHIEQMRRQISDSATAGSSSANSASSAKQKDNIRSITQDQEREKDYGVFVDLINIERRQAALQKNAIEGKKERSVNTPLFNPGSRLVDRLPSYGTTERTASATSQASTMRSGTSSAPVPSSANVARSENNTPFRDMMYQRGVDVLVGRYKVEKAQVATVDENSQSDVARRLAEFRKNFLPDEEKS